MRYLSSQPAVELSVCLAFGKEGREDGFSEITAVFYLNNRLI